MRSRLIMQVQGVRMAIVGAVSLTFAETSLWGCDAPEPLVDPPLRPLLYTETTSRVEGGIPGFEQWQDPAVDPIAWPTESPTQSSARYASAAVERPTTPEQLMLSTLTLLLNQRADELLALGFDPVSYAATARTNETDALRQVEELNDGLRDLASTFAPASASQARRGGLLELLEPGQLVVGRPRNVDGSAVQDGQAPAMHWGSELSVQLRDSNVGFVLRFPSILVDEQGIWHLADAPAVDARFRAWRNLGLDLKPELLDSSHAPFPLSVGNYWHYRTRRPQDTLAGDPERPVATNEGYRDEVLEVDDHGAYRVIHFRRLFDDPSRPAQVFRWLQTPLRVYGCTTDCVRNASNQQWVLTYGSVQVPLFSFPLRAAMGWGTGGVDSEDNVWRTGSDLVDVTVPAGTFVDTIELSRSVAGGRQLVHFVSGIGVVVRRNNTGIGTGDEELIDYRIMP
jgi:hypothetical protein